MIKQIIILIALSVLVILILPLCHSVIHYLLTVYHFIYNTLDTLFVQSKNANFIKQLIAFLAVPLGLGAILGSLYFAVRRQKMPYIMEIIWIIWVILATTLICQG
jgi:hypothetical protein